MSLIFYDIRNIDNLLFTDLTKLKWIRNYCFKLNSTHCTQMNDRYFLYGGKPFDCKTETYNSSTFFGKCHWLQQMFRKCLLVFAEKYFGTSLFWFLLSLSFYVKISRFAQLNYNFTTTVKFD